MATMVLQIDPVSVLSTLLKFSQLIDCIVIADSVHLYLEILRHISASCRLFVISDGRRRVMHDKRTVQACLHVFLIEIV